MTRDPSAPPFPPPADALWTVAPGRTEIRSEPLPAPGPGEVLVRARHGALSRGTERLVLAGRVPPAEHDRMRAPWMAGAFPFPVKYGYSTVGYVEAGRPDLVGRTVFTLHPHQTRFVLPADAVVPVPETVPARRAVLAANMETALNAVWDAGAGPADRIAVVGAGVVGLLVAYLCARLPGAAVTVVDIAPDRARLAAALGVDFASPDKALGECDLVVHASASAAGLATALGLAGLEAMVLELSWYGDGPVAAPLGGAFHSRRLTLRSSQVGQVSPSRRPRWTHRRRLEAALGLLADDRLDALLAPAVRFAELPARIAAMLAPDAGVLCPVIDYPTD
ncbi:dehydrogenase [Rhodoplanes sp. TEM]|uniref:Dehydrogenase n=1 Tax=Rhodoplanes tepidamans TaxID=200616 RepID=A0ABT5J949_RHOTP|nr:MULTISPECIES: dehydrogenase [Rhodoplanes]MDC7786018.1 dehydrogenase [Rhodoplanes tepidamans]MDC7983841.1 dehydrogenase [Rhodoplanes sp. TEM]MDQ0359150.1 threonine dehydrogenase-like Zn-dependent dehydrogenase [Rhodoplanes tepidamans]